jgi:hypothetical protein
LLLAEFKDRLLLVERKFPGGGIYIVAQVGFFVEAILYPVAVMVRSAFAGDLLEAASGLIAFGSRQRGDHSNESEGGHDE